MQAIVTKYLGPSNTKQGRIKATTNVTSITLAYDHALMADENHAAAAKALADKLGWRGEWIGGSVDNSGFVFVCASNDHMTFGPRFKSTPRFTASNAA